MPPPSTPLVAAGGLIWRPAASGAELLLVHRPKYDDWSLPKGKSDPGENPLQTAAREVREETGLDVTMGASLGTIEYRVKSRHKVVHYWSMRVRPGTSDVPRAEDVTEVDSFAWVAADRVHRVLTYRDDLSVVRRWLAVGQGTVSLLVVRHGRAGARAEWSGPDSDRPLDDKGQTQARYIEATLPAFAPAAVFCAQPLRCRQTVEPLSSRLGLPIRTTRALSDEFYASRPDRTIAELQIMLQSPQPIVACSQGDTIESALSVLIPPELGPFSCKKGGVWAIGVTDGRVTSADYYPSLIPDDN